MCGFYGEWAFSKKSNRELLKRISSLSARRGPDSVSFLEVDDLFLGFNRLAILDPGPNGEQPMKSPSGRYTLVYNGEIYNHFDIRRKLGHTYKGHCDTETLVYAFDEYGVYKTIDLLDGMFAMGIWDSYEKHLHLTRDFAGIKPLFYGYNSKGVVFASQYNQVVLHPWFYDNELDPQVLKLFLTQHFMPAPFGIIKETAQVRPGEIITINKNQELTAKQYWEFPAKTTPEIFDRDAALKILNRSLSESVKDEMLSDVPLGTFLSGGIDSPLVTYFAQQKTQDIKSFSIGSDSAKHDESEDATWYAKHLGVDHYLMQMDSSSALKYWEKSMATLYEPLADLSILPTYVVSNWAKKEVTVALSGDGGDELFFGYVRFWSIAKNVRFHGGPYWWRYFLYGTDRFLFRNNHINSTILSKDQGTAHQGLHSRFSREWLNIIFPDLHQVDLPEKFDNYKYPHRKDKRSLIGCMRKAEFYGMMQKTLRKVDLASMDNSLEVRVPFLKKSFIEDSLKLDPFLSFGSCTKKQILKDNLISKLPEAPITNQKRGFSIPLSRWIREDLKQPMNDLLLTEDHIKYFGLNESGLHQMMNEHARCQNDFKWPLFTIYALFKWKENTSKNV